MSKSFTRDAKLLIKPLLILANTNAVISLMSYVLTIALANILGPVKFGMYSEIIILSGLLAILVRFGTEHSASASYIKSGSVKEVANNVFMIRLVCGLLCFSVLFVAENTNYLFVVLVLLATLKNFDLSFLYEIRKKNERYSYVNLAERFVYISGAFILIYNDFIQIYGYLIILGIVTLAGICFQLFDCKNYKYFQLSFRSKGLVENIKQNIPITVVAISIFAYGGFSRLILEDKMGLEMLGIYSLGWQLITIGTIFQSLVYRLWRIRIATVLKLGVRKNLIREIEIYLLLATLPMVLVCGALTVFAEPIVTTIFSSEYVELIPLMPLFGLYIVLTSLAGLVEMLWVATLKNQVSMFVNITFSVLLLTVLFKFSGSFEMIDFLITTVVIHFLLIITLAYVWYLKFRNMVAG